MSQTYDNAPSFAPTTIDGRIVSLDVVRGFALWGILTANILIFTSPHMYALFLGGDFGRTGFDTMTQTLVYWFFQGKFYTLFSLLFGFGFMLLIDRAFDRVRRPRLFAVRRMVVLLCFGLVHTLFFWWGDILTMYALSGMLLIVFARRSVRTMLCWAIALFMLLVVASFFPTSPDDQVAVVDIVKQQFERAVQTYKTGSYAQILHQNFMDWQLLNVTNVFVGPFMVLPLFLFGAVLFRSGLWMRLHTDRSLRTMCVYCSAVIGGSLTVVKEMFRDAMTVLNERAVDAGVYLLASFFADIGLAVFYALVLLSLMQSPAFGRIVRTMRHAGRMALTNYVLQSVFCGFIFYPYGLGLFGDVPFFGLVGIAAVFFTFQVLYSRWWLRRYAMGPLEWVWRRLTYGRRSSATESA
jgi:uncharacterized protein